MTAHRTINALNEANLTYQIGLVCMDPNPYCIVLDHNQQLNSCHETLKTMAPWLNHRIICFPDTEVLPYDNIPTHPSIAANQIQALSQLCQQPQPILLTTKQAWQTRIAPKSFIEQHVFRCKVGDHIAKQSLQDNLITKGYTQLPAVTEAGTFTTRGAIIDIWPINSKHAYRIEWFDDEIDSIRSIDTQTQRSIRRHTDIDLIPAKMYQLTRANPGTIKNNLARFFTTSQLAFDPLPDLISGKEIANSESYLPVYHQAPLSSIFDYLPAQTQYILNPSWQAQVKQNISFWHERFKAQSHFQTLLEPNELILSVDQIQQRLGHAKPITWSLTTDQQERYTPLPPIKLSHDDQTGIQALKDLKQTLIFIVPNQAKTNNLQDHLTAHGIQTTVTQSLSILNPSQLDQKPSPHLITTGSLKTGFIDQEKQCAFISDHDLLGRVTTEETTQTDDTNPNTLIPWSQKIWDKDTLLVHRDHGIGRFDGIVHVTHQKQAQDFLLIYYAGNDKLYVPITSLNLLSRYIGPRGNQADLDKLGSTAWQKKRKTAIKAAEDLAAKLLSQHALRQANRAYSIKIDQQAYIQLCEDFPYEPTKGQQSAIDDVLNDLTRNKAMDRLICGDVGFGKTEVAIRAAFVAIMSGYQVALLAPTTVLADQHFHTFQSRFQSWPIRVNLCSRIQGKTKQTTLDDIASGNIDLVIGTHKILQSQITFKKLALLVVDEEHRFGVKHKEMIHHLRGQAHILSLSATPIPRTLNMAMSQLRDISIIATAPRERQAVHTYVHEYQDSLVKEAITRESHRGGQVYYLHNDIAKLPKLQEQLTRWFPSLNISIAHGQMPKQSLEKTMRAFYEKTIDLLICTTIIESGIHVPDANTIIIHRADLLGLSQIHQIRGRVGRSHHQAYAYLLTPSVSLLTKDAQARLDTISKHQTLGTGLNIALEDLEIRGAGDLLGSKQSGNIHQVGVELYSQYINRATQQLQTLQKNNPCSSLDLYNPIEINIDIPAFIPEKSMPDPLSRLNYYRKIQASTSLKDLNAIQAEIEDKYGVLAEETLLLLKQQSIIHMMLQKKIYKLVFKNQLGNIAFREKSNINPHALLSQAKQLPLQLSFLPTGILKIALTQNLKPLEKILTIQSLLTWTSGQTEASSV